MNPNMIVLKKNCFFSNRKITKENFKIGLHNTYLLLMFFIGVLGIYYIWTLNINATIGYEIRNLEIQKRSFITERELLEVRLAEVESLNYVLSGEYVNKMIPVSGDNEFLVYENKNNSNLAYIK